MKIIFLKFTTQKAECLLLRANYRITSFGFVSAGGWREFAQVRRSSSLIRKIEREKLINSRAIAIGNTRRDSCDKRRNEILMFTLMTTINLFSIHVADKAALENGCYRRENYARNSTHVQALAVFLLSALIIAREGNLVFVRRSS